MIMALAAAPAFAQPVIDSVWMSEETDCDGKNIVEICYRLSGETADVTVLMSPDLGINWDVPLDSLSNDAGDLGIGVSPGVHCFDWHMEVDLPDTEGTQWMVRAQVVSILDTFNIIDSISVADYTTYGWGLAFGSGYYWIYEYSYSDTNTFVYKANCLDRASCPPVDSIRISRGNCDIDYQAGYIYHARSGSAPTQIYRANFATGAREVIANVPNRGDAIQGVDVSGDSLIGAFYDEDVSNRLTLLYFDLRDPFPITSWDTVLSAPIDTCTAIEGMTQAVDFLWGSNNLGRIMQIDMGVPEYADCFPVPNIGNGAEGLCFDGEFIWYDNRETDNIYKIAIIDSTTSHELDRENLDSKPPYVAIHCPDSAIAEGVYDISWFVFDYFYYYGETCSLYIDYGDRVESHLVDDTVFTWRVPPDFDSAEVRVVVPDYYCNWGEDICHIYSSEVEPIGNLIVRDESELLYLRLITIDDAEAAGNGVIMVQMPDTLGAADLVDTTDVDASPVLIRTPYGIRSWRADPAPD